MSKKKVEAAVQEFLDWIPNYDRKQIDEMVQIIGRMLGSLPGGDEWEDLGFETYPEAIGWKEFEMITDIFAAIDDKMDVEQATEMLLHSDDEDEDDDE